jgi:hypothetical protein
MEATRSSTTALQTFRVLLRSRFTLEDLDPGENDLKHVVEIVRNAAREPPDRFEPLGALELLSGGLELVLRQ